MPYKDKEKQKQFLHAYQIGYHQNRYATAISKFIGYLGGECKKCSSVEQLEFDHIDRATKSFAITKYWNRKWEIIKPELDKCQLLCHDCHKEKTKVERRKLV